MENTKVIHCPECEAEIDHLNHYVYKEDLHHFSIVDGKPVDKYICDQAERGDSYDCPECCEEIFDNYADAVNFLKGM